jgi:uncharacterized phage protein gp47/JayE
MIDLATRDEILARLAIRLYGQGWAVTDLTPASVARMLIEAVVDEVMLIQHEILRQTEAWSLLTARGDDLTRRARDFGVIFERRPATKARGDLAVTTTGPATIPAGWVVATGDGREYAAMQGPAGGSWTLPAGTSTIQIEAVLAGAQGNAAAHEITHIRQALPNVQSVTNPTALSSGRDAESDDELRMRIIALLRGPGPGRQQLERAVLDYRDNTGQPAIEALGWVERPGLVDSGGAPVAAILYVSGPSGSLPPGALAAAQQIVDERRAAGMPVAVAAAQAVPITLRLAVEFDQAANVAVARQAVLAAVHGYAQSLAVGGTRPVGDALFRVGMVEALVVHVPGVLRARVITPSSDVNPGEGQRIVLGEVDVTTWA